MDQEQTVNRTQFKWLPATRAVCIVTIVVQVLQVIRNVYMYSFLSARELGWYHYHEIFRTGVPITILGGGNVHAGFLAFFFVHIAYSLGIIILTVLLWMGTMGTETEDGQPRNSNKFSMVNVWIMVHWTIFVIEMLMDLMLTLLAAFANDLAKDDGQEPYARKLYLDRTSATDTKLVPDCFLPIWIFLAFLAFVYRVATICIVSRFKSELRQRWVPQPMMMMTPMMTSYQMQQYPSRFQAGGVYQVPVPQLQLQPQPQWTPNAAPTESEG